MSFQLDEKIIPKLSFLKGHTSIDPIDEGYSGDHKYLVVKAQKKFLLRTFDAQHFSHKQKEYAIVKTLYHRGIKCALPLEMGILPNTSVGYAVSTFLEGSDGRKILPTLSSQQQLRAGLDAGHELKKINEYVEPHGLVPWHDRKLAKHLRYASQVQNGDIRLRDEERVLSFVDARLDLMKDRPNTFQHDDYHPGNLIFDGESFVGAIDFNRYDWGDPVHEFLKVAMFGAETSVPFSIGQIRGYFNDRDPDEQFWQLYSLYTAMSLISCVVWTKHVCPDEMPKMLAKCEKILDDHDSFERVVPKWYVAAR